MTAVAVAARYLNKAAMPLVTRFSRWPATGRVGMGVVSYRGHRSGRHFSLIVGFSPGENGLTIGVAMPDQKRWWRNFQHQRRPLVLEVAGKRHSGQALATRNERGQVQVHIDLD